MAGSSARRIFADLDEDGVVSPTVPAAARSASVNCASATAQLIEEGSSPGKRYSQDSPLLRPTISDIVYEGASSDGEGGDEDSILSTTSWDQHYRAYFVVPMKTRTKLLMASSMLLLLGVSARILTSVPGSSSAMAPDGARGRIEAVQVGSWQDGAATNGVTGAGGLADKSEFLVAPPAKPEASPFLGTVQESSKSLLTESLQPPKSAETRETPQEIGMNVAPARSALGIQGLRDGLQSIPAPNLQSIWNMVNGDGDDTSSDYDCQEDLANWKVTWTPDKQLYCCNAAGVGCAQQEYTTSVEAADDTDNIDDLLLEGNPHIYKPLVGADGAFQSGVPLCDVGQDSCPKEWWTGPTGGFYCPDGTDKKCRSLEEGPWDPQECKSQCSIGNTPITTTVTTTSTTITRTYPGMSIKLLCWSLCNQQYELDIMHFQMQRTAGIFDCDETMVLTYWPVTIDGGNNGKLDSVVIPRENVGRSKDGTAGNALQFMKAWDAVAHDGRWTQVDWVLKVDPDAVVLTDRIRIHLNPYQGQHVYVRNCDKPMSEGAMMFGALEAIAVPALQTYFNAGGRCFHEIPWQAWGEDLFMMRCLEHLGVGPVGDFQLIQDGVCKGVWCGSNWAAAFHPMKSVWAWENCWNQAIAAR